MKHSSANPVYGLGLLGALVYNMQYASSFSQVLWGLVKAFLWPGFLVYELLSFLQI